MHTDQRLTEAYKSARVEYIDDHSKYVFLSDCHRSDGSLSDEFIKNRNIYLYALEYYYNNGFIYVEAGDGDELWEQPGFNVIRSAHADVFSMLKKFCRDKRLIMLYGNHNIYLKDQEYVKNNYYCYFNDYDELVYDLLEGIEPVEALVLKNKNTGQEILAVHGHQGDFTNDQFWVPTMLSIKYFWRFLHAFGFRNPSSPVKNISKRHKIEKNFKKWISKNKMMLICGHTHRYKYPKNKELPYFNTGCCVYPSSITAIEIHEGNIQLVRWRIRANREGVLHVERGILRGPDPIGNFDIKTY